VGSAVDQFLRMHKQIIIVMFL